MRRIAGIMPLAVALAAAPALHAPTAGAAPAAPSQVTARTVALDATRIGNVRLGGKPADTVKKLTMILGKPDKAGPVEGCRIAGQPAGYEARWGALSVYGQGTSARTVRMGSWALSKGRTPVRLNVSHGIRPGMTASQVKATGARTTRLNHDMFRWTMRAAGLHLFFTDRSPHRVETIIAKPYWCE